MADESVSAPVVNDQDPAIAAADEMKLLGYAVQELPAHAVKDLFAHEVCAFLFQSLVTLEVFLKL